MRRMAKLPMELRPYAHSALMRVKTFDLLNGVLKLHRPIPPALGDCSVCTD